MNHDVIEERYARLFELPDLLARKRNLLVSAVCLDYRVHRKGPISDDLKDTWRCYNIPRTLFVGWLFALLAHVQKLKPQCVVASSDCLHVILGGLIARCVNAKYVVDLYDDYSTFGLAKIPGIKWLYHRALLQSDGICAVSRTLGRFIEEQYPDKPVLVLESTIDSAKFYPRDKVQSIELLGLTRFNGKKLVGVCGGLNAFHGADIVFASFAKISEQRPDVVFVVAGPLYPECPLPNLPNVAYLGVLPHRQMPHFFSAMNVAVIALSNTRFGYFAFPQKAYEVLACAVPVAAADVGALSLLFADAQQALYNSDSPESLAATVIYQLQAQYIHHVDIPTWQNQAEELEKFIVTL